MTSPSTTKQTFLRLPRRSEKPRFVGLTHVIDKGLPVAELESRLAVVGEYVDVWKLGFGTAYLDPTVEDKVAALGRAGIRACLGGTLLEVAWAQGRRRGMPRLGRRDRLRLRRGVQWQLRHAA